ncbi:hypothetical protein PENSPDRAFT_340514 [Peniophora sp. CONT]|nr:hypothetical protein PENSPDRAFT_340514 [Peniophora sp. CONT]
MGESYGESELTRLEDHPLLKLAQTRLDTFHSAASSANRTPSSLQKLRADIEFDLNAAEVIKSQLAEALNACAPVSSLPIELLRAIFELVAQDYRPCGPVDIEWRREIMDGYQFPRGENMAEPDWLSEQGGCLGWISLGHICRAWRGALLAHAALWADDFGSLPGAVNEFLDRSNGLPLTVRTYSAKYRNSSAPWHALFRDDVRCRVQRIYCVETRPHVLFGADYAALTTCHFPILETLCITGNEPIRRRGPITVLPVMSAPQLRRLELSNVFIPVSSEMIEFISCKLTFEDDGRHTIIESGILRPEDLLPLLNRSRETLSSLVVDKCLPSHLDHWYHPTRISIPRLQSLTVDWDYNHDSDTASFLDGLILNDTTILNIRVELYENSDRGRASMQGRIGSAIMSVNGLGFDALACFASDGP